MEKEVTIYDIAKILGISPATVSRALSDHPAINVKTKARIAKTAGEMGYRSNTFASNLRRRTTRTLGVIVPRLDSSFMSAVLAGMEQAANLAGYNLLISQSLESEKKEKANAETMYASHVDGLMVSVAYDTSSGDHFESFISRKIPVLFFDRVLENPHSTSIVIDNFQAGFEATSHLIDQGCRRIMHVTGNLKRNVYSGRFEGYEQALNKHGLTFDESLILVGDLSAEAGIKSVERLHEMIDKPDGMFVGNDVCAVSCVKSLKAKGYSIPGDIAVAGFNNDPVSQVIEPNLTTVFYPGRQMGEVAVTTMISHLNGTQKMDATKQIILPSELIIRESSTKKAGKATP